ncbi:hypothetical protein PHA51_07715 [Rodentibacter pneumotropicus]|uniref:hypothetical protein n=1 Tax=Rodentibacter TaxID=1960084 RepID=UPI00232FAD2A|nr:MULTISPECIES: hypothetical protein [Rodentibacter]MDC2825915.1 hypothetical protein [Rodentibacter pneumotropicus]
MKFPRKRQIQRWYILAYYSTKYILFRFKKWQHPRLLKVIYAILAGLTVFSFLYFSLILTVFAFIAGLTFLILKFAGKFADFSVDEDDYRVSNCSNPFGDDYGGPFIYDHWGCDECDD